MHVNPERPHHSVFAGLDRRRFELWSDYTGWDQTKPGFPKVYPVTHGFRLKSSDDLARTAILANYDRGLEGIALCEMFAGKGSVLLSAFDLIPRAGLDPVADRLLRNLVTHLAAPEGHEVYPLVEGPIRWGDYPSERGVVSGPLNGLVVNCRWQAPPTEPGATPLADNTGAWNVNPGDGFVPHGRRVFAPFAYTTATGVRDLSKAPAAAARRTPGVGVDDDAVDAPDDTDNAQRPAARDGASPTGTGVVWLRVPPGKRSVVTTVENPAKEPGRLTVTVNGVEAAPAEIAPGQKASIRAVIGDGATDLAIRYAGHRHLVLVETRFE
jgi:hypothetical protein